MLISVNINISDKVS